MPPLIFKWLHYVTKWEFRERDALRLGATCRKKIGASSGGSSSREPHPLTHAAGKIITSSVNASVRTSERCTVELVVLCVFLSARTKNIAYRPPAACFFSLLLLCSSLFLFIIYAEEVILSSLCVYLSAGKLKTSLATDFNELPGGVE